MSVRRILVGAVTALVLLAGVLIVAVAPSIAAGGLLHPIRVALYTTRPAGCVDREFAGDGLTLRGWFCAASADRRGTAIYLHGVADNRSSGIGVIDRLRRHGYDVVAYDSRAHGESDGEACTYGFYERRDLARVIETVPPGPVVLFGNSLGAAVAILAAVGNPRVTAVVAAEAYSDLRTIAMDRAPRVLPALLLDRAFRVAEERGRFEVARVSPVEAASSLRVPVLLIHGADDVDTPPDHSRRILSALAGPKRLVLVPHAGHNQSLRDSAVWTDIEQWLASLDVTQ
jgi:pimeloyl-ACP methyl ester carboxylesterase